MDGACSEKPAKRLAKLELIARSERFSVFRADGDEAVLYEKNAAGKSVLTGTQAQSFWEELMALKAINDCRREITMDVLCETYQADTVAELSAVDRSLLALAELPELSEH